MLKARWSANGCEATENATVPAVSMANTKMPSAMATGVWKAMAFTKHVSATIHSG